MFRRTKKSLALVAALLLGALQFHSVLHLLGSDGHAQDKAACVVCEASLSQVATHASTVAPELRTELGFACVEISIPCLTPQFRGFSPTLRAPPTVS